MGKGARNFPPVLPGYIPDTDIGVRMKVFAETSSRNSRDYAMLRNRQTTWLKGKPGAALAVAATNKRLVSSGAAIAFEFEFEFEYVLTHLSKLNNVKFGLCVR